MAKLLQEFQIFEYAEAAEKYQHDDKTMLSGTLQRANAENQNNRIYPRPILEREVDKYHEMIDENRALGELDHPEDSVINLRNVSHKITEVYMDGDKVMGKMQVLGLHLKFQLVPN